MIELLLIRSLLDFSVYNKHRSLVDSSFLEKNLPETYKLLECIDYMHSLKENQIFSIEDLELTVNTKLVLKPNQKELYESLFETLRTIEVTPEVCQEALSRHLERSYAAQLALLSLTVAEGKTGYEELQKFIESPPEISAAKEFQGNGKLVTQSLQKLKEEVFEGKGFNWRLNTLQKMLGPLRKGDFGFVYARPEVGKTTFLADQVSYFCTQLGEQEKIVHFNNEEEGKRVMLRYFQAALALPTKDLFSGELQTYEDLFYKETKAGFLLYDDASISRKDVESFCEEYKPALIVIDSIDKIKGFEDDRDDLVYKAIYQWARELAKKYGPVIGVCHAAVSAEGKRWLNMDDVAYAKTAKQGEADWILGIGKIHDEGYEYTRYLHLSKNKLLGSSQTEEALRHGHCTVRINREIARYIDLEDE